MKEYKHQNTAYHWVENLVLAFLGLYLLFLALRTTMFHLDIPWKLWSFFFYVLSALGMLQLVLMLAAEKAERSLLIRVILFALPVVLVWMLVFHSDGYPFLRCLAALTLGCVGIDYHKVLKLYVGVVGLAVLTAVICALGGAIPNLVYLQLARIRSAWGIQYTTDFASYLLFLSIMAWIAWPKLPDFIFLFPGIIGLLLSYFIAQSNTGVFCFAVYLILVLLHCLLRRHRLLTLQKLTDALCCAAFPVFGTGMLVLTWLYHMGNSFAIKIDKWNHSRLSLASKAFDEHGLTLFGTPFDQIGAGGSTFSNPNYNFVDCSYLMLLLRYGVVTLIVVTVLWVLMTRAAIKLNDRRLALGMALIAVHCISEHHFPELNYNILLILPFALFYAQLRPAGCSANDVCSSGVHTGWGLHPGTSAGKAILVTGSLFLVALALFGFCLISWFRTLCSIFRMDSGVYHQRALFAAVYVGLVFLLLCLIPAVYRVIHSLLSREKPALFPILVTVCSAAAMLAGVFVGNMLFRQTGSELYDVIKQEKPAIELVKNSGSMLYVDDYPAVYEKELRSVQTGLFNGEDLARLQNVSLITDIGNNANVLFNRGFLYAPVSDTHALYTNSQDTIAALTSSGYHLTGYYPVEDTVDLAHLGRWNGLTMTGDGGLYLDHNNPLAHGPELSLFSSAYTVDFSFRLPHDMKVSFGEGSVAAEIRISSWWGDTEVKDLDLLYSQFDEEGSCHISLTFRIPASSGVEFLIFPAEGASLVLCNIQYRQTPSYDTHSVYDQTGKIIHSSYYDLDGNPYYGNWGYQAVDYAYDDNRNIILERYYDETGEPVLCANGYSEIHRVYNRKKQLLHEEYLDTDGSPRVMSAGQSAVEYGYDEAGNCNYCRYYDCDGAPVMTSLGYCELHRTFNAEKNIVREEYFDEDGTSYYQSARYVAFEQEWENGSLRSRTYLDPFGYAVNRTDGYEKALWPVNDNGVAEVIFLDNDGNEVTIDGLNLARDIRFGADGWSAWFTPEPGIENSCFNIGSMNLGKKAEGDTYTCRVEIEFRDVSAENGYDFRFLTQGSQDGKWFTGNVWDGHLVSLQDAPEDGIYEYTSTVAVSGSMADVSTFNIGFRCDYWASGSFRVRSVKIERGDTATAWSPGL